MAKQSGVWACVVLVAPIAMGQERPAADPRPISPTQTRAPGVVPASPAPGPGDLARLETGGSPGFPLRREGTFLVRARGVMARLPGGEVAFVFARDSEGKSERPMVLLPNQALQRMEQSAGGAGRTAGFVLTGQVLVYAGVNYVLVSEASMLAPEPATIGTTEAGTPAEKAANPESQEPAPRADASPVPGVLTDDPSVQDLVRRLAWQRERPRTIERTDARREDRPRTSSESVDVLPEGRMIVKRKGRLVRGNEGDWTFAMDSTPDAKADAPLTLLPCANLQRLDTWAGTVGEGGAVEVTGRVTMYRERNYLLVTMFRLLPTAEVTAR